MRGWLAAVVGLSMVACGGDDSGAGTGAPTTGSPTDPGGDNSDGDGLPPTGLPDPADGDNQMDPGVTPGGGPMGGGATACVPTDKLDLLFVIDNSSSMSEEQETLAREIPRMARILATGDKTPDDPSDNDQEGVTFDGVKSMHLGVVSTNMGAAGNDVTGCTGTGDDGRLVSASSAEQGCGDDYPAYLSFTAEDDAAANDANAMTLGTDFSCMSLLGTTGCGLEQQLDAMLKALVTSDASIDTGAGPQPLRFSGDTTGHGDGPHMGFVREDAVLGVVVVTDEDDCSLPDESSDLFSLSPDGAFADEPLNLRCGNHNADTVLHPIERYSQGLKTLKPDEPERVVFASIVGIPPDLDTGLADGTLTVAQVLEDPRMVFQADGDPTQGDTLPVTSCSTDNGVAFPPVRIVQVAEQFNVEGGPNNGVVRSICNSDYGPALDAIIEALSAQLGCLI